ncbi:hypothetical protein DV735_g4449, partial [Chaetothyriales sp. CBS 134920]
MATDGEASDKPSVLIVGGLGYIGRFLAKYLHDHQLASTVRLVDKVLPQLARLAPEFSEACSPSLFLQADASRESSMAAIFNHPGGPEKKWDYVFNLGGQTAVSRTIEEYKLQIVQLSVTLGKEAARRGVKAFVEVSTGMVYAPDRKPRVETDKLKPWLKQAKAKLEAESELARIPGLNLVILRLPHVYGPYDAGFIAKALCLARVYQDEGKELKWLWTEDLRINTVHIDDTVRALWEAAKWREVHSTVPDGALLPSGRRSTLSSKGDDPPTGDVPIFNIVDHGETSQGVLADIVAKVFDIKTGFQGSLISQFAKLNLENVVDDVNEDILQPWADLLEEKGITRPGPLSPFLEKELLKDTDLSLDGTLFEKVVGFEYQRGEGLTVDNIKAMIDRGIGTITALNLELSGECAVTAVLRSNYNAVKDKGFEIDAIDYGKISSWRPTQVLNSVPNNGINIERPILAAFPDNVVLSGISRMGVNELRAGVILQDDPDRLGIAPFENPRLGRDVQVAAAREFVRLYNAAGRAVCSYDADLRYERWRKLVYNAVWNPVYADPIALLVRPAMEEVIAVAASEGVSLDRRMIDEVVEAEPVDVFCVPSMLQDVRKGRPVEVENILGEVVRTAERNGVPVPVIKVLYALLKARQWRTIEASGLVDLQNSVERRARKLEADK